MLHGSTTFTKATIRYGKDRTYDRYYITIPIDMVRDSQFPFKQGEKLSIILDPGRKCLIISPIERPVHEAEPKRIDHINIYEDHVILRDNILNRTVFVYIRDGELICDLCEATDCLHVLYTKTLLGRKIEDRSKGVD